MTAISLIPEPIAREAKPAFADIPLRLLEKIENVLEGKIISGDVIYGGFSASAGYKLTLAGGHRVFAKGAHPQEQAHGTQQLRQELSAYRSCPVLQSVSPRLLGHVEDGGEDGWLLGLWEYIPSSAAPVAGMIETLATFQREDAAAMRHAAAQNYIALFLDPSKKWRRLKDETAAAQKFLKLFDDAEPWLWKNIGTLCALQGAEPEGPEGLLHGDLRADNFIFDGKKTFVVDWPNACRGPLLFDAVFLFANLEALGLCPMEEAFKIYEAAGGAPSSLQQRAAMAVKIAGFFADQAYRAVPPKLPRLRWMQQGILLALLRYLSRLGIIDSYPRMVFQNT